MAGRRVITDLLQQAVDYAQRGQERDFTLGAIGVRKDGAQVKARNSAAINIAPDAHAEARLCRKLDVGAIVYVGRVKKDGSWALARPCRSCRDKLRKRGIKMVYYTIGPNEYGVLNLDKFVEEKNTQKGRLDQFDIGRWKRGQ